MRRAYLSLFCAILAISVFCAILAMNFGDLQAQGLIGRLPADGSKVTFDLQSSAEFEADDPDLAEVAIPNQKDVRGTVTLSSVGREKVDRQQCRWIEIGREIPDQQVKSVLKLLIPEKNFGRGEDPLSHVTRMVNWNPDGMVKEPEPIIDPARKRYEIERFRGFIPERLNDVKPLGKRVIQTPLGPIECEGRVGTAELPPSPLFPGKGGEWAWEARIEVWESDRSPFGVVLLKNHSTGYETVGNTGKKIRFKSVTTLTMSAMGNDIVTPRDSPPPPSAGGGEQAAVKGKVTDPNGKAVPGVRVLFQIPGSNETLASVTAADGTYEVKAPVGSITVRITHRTVGSDGKPKAVILLNQQVEVPAEGKTLDLVTQKEVPK